MPDGIILARRMTALDLDFEKALHYHSEGCESDNVYGLTAQVMRLCTFINSQQLRPPLAPPPTRKCNIPPLSSCPNHPGMTFPSVKGSASA